MLPAPVRTSLIAAAAILFIAGCADAPITAADILADGQLRRSSVLHEQNIHAASEANRPKAQLAERLRVTGILATQADGPLEDMTRFPLDSEAIYLHLRADDLSEPRPVTFVWTHHDNQGERRRETMGFLQPAETITLASSLPLNPEIEGQEPDPLAAAGRWTIEVYSTDANGRSLVFERDFEVLEVAAYEAMLAEASTAGVPH